MNELIAHGRVTRGHLGVDLNPSFSRRTRVLWEWRGLGARGSTGFTCLRPRRRPGIRDGDVVLRFAGVEIIDLNHLINMVSMSAVGQTAEVVVWRGRREYKLSVIVGERDRTLTPAAVAPDGGRATLRTPQAAQSSRHRSKLRTRARTSDTQSGAGQRDPDSRILAQAHWFSPSIPRAPWRGW